MKEVTWDIINNKQSLCLCGLTIDNYCRCGPSLATDVIAFTKDLKNIILVDRGSFPFGFATVGGFVEVGESIESAIIREFEEETHLQLNLNTLMQMHTYSDPNQDPRRPAASLVFIAIVNDEKQIKNGMEGGDDAKNVILWSVEKCKDILNDKYKGVFGFDLHRTFIHDAIQFSIKQNILRD